MEFQVILNKLNVAYTVNDVEIKSRTNLKVKSSSLRNARSKPRSKKGNAVSHANQSITTRAIPSVENFQEFKQWLLKKLSLL